MESMKNWYQFFTRCEELIPDLNGVKFTKREIYSSSVLNRSVSYIRFFLAPKTNIKLIDKKISQKCLYRAKVFLEFYKRIMCVCLKKLVPCLTLQALEIFTALFENAVLIRCHHNKHSFNPLSATYNLQQTTISNFAAFSKIKNKV